MTIKDIARLAGVSISTVSKIMNGKDDNINCETKARVLRIAKEYHYAPYAMAKQVSDAKTFIIGILLSSLSTRKQLTEGIITAAQAEGYSIMVFDSKNDHAIELKHIASLCKHKVDGVIWEPVDKESLQYQKYFDGQNTELCFVNSAFVDAYLIDFVKIGYTAGKLMIDYGHTHIGCLAEEDDPASELVLDGFKKCLFDHNITFHDGMLLTDKTNGWYSQILAHKLTGIISVHYHASLRLLKKLDQFHYRLPYDLSLISLLESDEDNTIFPEISCIKIPYTAFGSYVARQLIAKCEKQPFDASGYHPEYTVDHLKSLGVPFTSRAKKIVVVGSINIDITLNVKELPQSGKTVSTTMHSITPGGKGANQAVGVARLGNDVSLIGKVGGDYDSALAYACLAENHVDTLGVRRADGKETGKAYIQVQPDGESMITILAGANQDFSAKDIAAYENLFKNASYCLLQTEVSEKAIAYAAEIAHKHGALNILKPSAMNKIPDSLMRLIDIFVPNQKESELLCPDIADIEGKADAFCRQGAKTVIITLGHSGCYLKSDPFTGYLPADNVMAVDNTGAADAFIAALAVYLGLGYPIEKAAKIAAYAAGFCVSRQGVIPALIDKNSLETYISRMEPGLLI